MLDVITVFISIIVEATPFLLIGTLIAVLVQKYNLFNRLIHRLPSNLFLRRISISLLGVALPVCECGNVPLARSLMRRGLSVSEATTFLLAAPILNPVTFIATKEAFRSAPWMLPARMLGGFFTALLIGEVIGRIKGGALRSDFISTCKKSNLQKERYKKFTIQFAEEFLGMFKLLAMGGAIASLTQLIINQNTFSDISNNYIVGVGIMLVVGFIISICSSVDAFFALGYAGTFRYGALLAFLIAGPMVDIKLLAMLKNTYAQKALYVLVASVATLSLIIGLVASYVR